MKDVNCIRWIDSDERQGVREPVLETDQMFRAHGPCFGGERALNEALVAVTRNAQGTGQLKYGSWLKTLDPVPGFKLTRRWEPTIYYTECTN